MTHSDIYTKFMIEYDKADVTSSYPSLTKYEVATILDKAYLALIAQKLTGNNPRKVSFEADVKNTEDLRPLVVNKEVSPTKSTIYKNEYTYTLPDNFMYYVQALVKISGDDLALVKFKKHDEVSMYKYTDTNYPWISHPIAYPEDKGLNIIFDADCADNGTTKILVLTYIKEPNKFVKGSGKLTTDYDFGATTFQLSDSMAEELINLAIIMSTEIVESSRLTTKINTRPLES